MTQLLTNIIMITVPFPGLWADTEDGRDPDAPDLWLATDPASDLLSDSEPLSLLSESLPDDFSSI